MFHLLLLILGTNFFMSNSALSEKLRAEFHMKKQCDQYWLISATMADFGVWVAGKI